MKLHTSGFKEEIKLFGKELDSKITYITNGTTTVLTSEYINSITPCFNGNILKSVMKQIDIDSNIDIPINTMINYQFGVKINGEYEYLDFGNYIVASSEKQEATNSYKIVCYDKMIFSMVPYIKLNIEYPISISNYIKAICGELGLEFANENNIFTNYDKLIANELYLDEDGNSLNYTFRDVLDELAQVTASTICINNDDKLEIRYISNTNDTVDEEYLKDVNVNFGKKYGPVNSIVLSRSAESDSVYLKNEESVTVNGLCEIKIIDNQIMNWNDRSEYLPDILERLNGLEYYINDFTSTGICYYDLCDKYKVSIGNKEYSCVMFNDEINITQGLVENIYTEMPKESQTDYSKADKTDKRINQVYLIVNKQDKKINSLVQTIDGQNEKISYIEQSNVEIKSSVSEKVSKEEFNSANETTNENFNILRQQQTELSQKANNITATITDIQTNGVQTVKNTMVVIDIEGIKVSVDTDAFSSLLNNRGIFLYKYGSEIGRFTPEKTELDNLTVRNYLVYGYHRKEKYNDEKYGRMTGTFWVGD